VLFGSRLKSSVMGNTYVTECVLLFSSACPVLARFRVAKNGVSCQVSCADSQVDVSENFGLENRAHLSIAVHLTMEKRNFFTM